MPTALRRSIHLFAVVIAGTICGISQDSSPAAAKQFSGITVHQSCEAMPPDSCPGSYGFSVTSDGKFKAGPDRKGSIVEGAITTDELQTLTSSVNSQLASGDKETCLDIRVIGITKVIAASLKDGTQVNLLTEGSVPSGRCFLGDYQKAKVVGENVSKLLGKYYPRSFPKP